MVKNREKIVKRGGWYKERCYEIYYRLDVWLFLLREYILWSFLVDKY